MSDIPEQIRRQVESINAEIQELVDGPWSQRQNSTGSNQLRSVGERIVLSAKRLQNLVRENTFSR
jgi:hypothetical protein